MAQPISNLALGDKVWISDNGIDELYEIAGFDVHGEDTATLVKAKVSDQSVYWNGEGSGVYDYDGSPLDYMENAYEQRFSARHRHAIKYASVICREHDAAYKTIARKVFALSATEVGGGSGGENAPLPLYTSNASRIKEGDWPLRTISYIASNPEGSRWGGARVREDGSMIASWLASGFVVPAFVIQSDTMVSDMPTGGGYEIHFPDAEAIASPIHPYGEYVQNDDDVTFEWAHSAETGTPQTRADIQYREYGAAWQDLLTISGEAGTATLPAYTFDPGRFFWRIRTYNEDGVAGPWSSEVAFVCVGAPVVPVITAVTITNRPIVAWESSGQIGYQVQIGEYDTGEVGGQAKTHKIPYYIPSGTYTARVRIKGAALLWSAWAEQEFAIDVTGPAKPTLTAEAITGAAQLTFTAPDAEKLYLLRDGIPIANVTGLTTYTDYAALGSAVYVLRAVDASDNYTDSDPVGVTVAVPLGMVAALAAVDDLNNPVALKLTRGVRRSITGSKIRAATYHHYAGREYPVARYSGHSTGSYELSVAFISALDRDRLLTLLDRRRTMLYRDKWGNRWYVTIPDNGYEQDRIATSITLTMHVTDYVEQIDYEV